MTIWLTSSPTSWSSWTCRRSRLYERESRGGPPYHPRMMVKVLLYGYCVGVASSRRIAQRLVEDIAFRVLAANNTPDFRTISDFRKDNLEVGVVCTGTGVVPAVGSGEAGSCGWTARR